MKTRILNISFLLLGYSVTHAQVQNTGRIHISGAADVLYISNAFTNANTATLTNNGQLHLLQGLTNNESMTVGTGTLYLSGSSNQSIAGSQPFRTNNLIINNSAGVTLNNNLHVSNTHTFTTGIITTSATPNYMVYESGSSHSGSGDNRHVNGWVKKIGSTDFAFPVGNGTVVRPVSLTNISASSEFNVRHNTVTPNTANMQSPIINVDGSEYWTINRVTGGNARVLMNWNHSKIAFPGYVVADIRAVYYNVSQWTNQGGTASGTISTTGTITSNVMSAFGNFTFGSISAVLPVHFLSINGKAEKSFNTISWKTAEEYNVHHYEIMRSADGTNFVTIGTVDAKNIAGTSSYAFDDKNPLDKAWYRVKNVDIDGKSAYTSIILLSRSGDNNGLTLVNSIVDNIIYLKADGTNKDNYQYQVMNMSGQIVQKGQINIQQQRLIAINIDQKLSAGMYLLNIFNNTAKLQEKIIVR